MHIPVLLKEISETLDPRPGGFFIDGTLGEGGQAKAILSKIGSRGKLLGLDWDESSLAQAKRNIKAPNVLFVKGNYADLPLILKRKKLPPADGLLLDLGFCSGQLESGRGFTFQKDEPLDMRYDRESGPSAADILNGLSEKELEDIFSRYGEERFSKRIARAVGEARRKKKIERTRELAEIIRRALPGGRYGQTGSLRRVFQALRIYVNRELENLEAILKNLTSVVRPGGRAAIISFHSLEDRLVKNYFREGEKEGGFVILTKKPIRPEPREILENPRSRSAKLRAVRLRTDKS
ncbi:MAG TPA: 16S rRNA (cytosine(1402)-N(4))-methyltransferase RsmH [Candidatus Tyrphobacter sp.]|nr:16S rRNA (cytosine(1402)-N(4))-methyltransferase RsmH [Candidatus Tyrphobacter sp.]